MNWPWMFVALAVGLLIGAAVARLMYDRQSRRVRDAEDRARRAERLAELGAMTGGLAHEIKNPLSTIGLNAQLIAEGVAELKGGPGDDEVKPRLINRVGARRETERLRGILQDFLEYAGSIRLEKRPTELNAMVIELVDFLTPEAERAGVRLRADLGGGQATGGGVAAPVDTRLLKQALLNLLLNAIQAIKNAPGADGAPFKGEVILRTSIEQRQAAGGAAKSAPMMAAVRVIDTGPGIAPETLARVFQPYFTTKSGGTGLGLPTARRLIEEHGGTLTVESAVGRGTTFTALLPLAEPLP